MNIIECKVDADKLNNLINRGYIKKLKDMHLCMNKDTMNCIESSLKVEPSIQYKPNKNKSCLPYYYGIPIATTNKLKFGEVQLLGFEEKPCTRITMYTDGTQKVETNVTDKVLICFG